MTTAWCSEIGSLMSLNACKICSCIVIREPFSLHGAVHKCTNLMINTHNIKPPPCFLYDSLTNRRHCTWLRLMATLTVPSCLSRVGPTSWLRASRGKPPVISLPCTNSRRASATWHANKVREVIGVFFRERQTENCTCSFSNDKTISTITMLRMY